MPNYERVTVTVPFDPASPRVPLTIPGYDPDQIKGIFSAQGYGAGKSKDFRSMWTFSENPPAIVWDVTNGAQATSFQDVYNRPNGPVGNGWTAYGGTSVAIWNQKVSVYNGGALGQRDYGLIQRANDAGPGGTAANGSDDNPLVMNEKISWIDSDVTVDSIGTITGIFMYWDTNSDPTEFFGIGVGTTYTNGVLRSGLYVFDYNYWGWYGEEMDALYRNQFVYARISLTSKGVSYQYSFTGQDDDWHDHSIMSNPVGGDGAPHGMDWREYANSAYNMFVGAPTHFMVGRGWANWVSGEAEYLRNPNLET